MFERDIFGRERLRYPEEIPEDMLPILRVLEELDEIKRRELYGEGIVMRERRRLTGEQIVMNIRERGFKPSLTHPRGISINIIPPVGEKGPCADTLLVVIGETDSFKVRVLEAIEHCGVICSGRTKRVIFYAFKWNDVEWKKHEESFKLLGTVVVLKPFGRPPVRVL